MEISFHPFTLVKIFFCLLIFTFQTQALGSQLKQIDFNGDGYADTAIGSPDKDVRKQFLNQWVEDAGQVTLLFGSQQGLHVQGKSINIINRAVEDVAGELSQGQQFGAALSAGDFNGDGLSDLAIGIPGSEEIQIFLSSESCDGICLESGVILHRNLPGVIGIQETGDQFGSALTSGDFNGDGYEDLAVGVPQDDMMGKEAAGSVHIFYANEKGFKGDLSHRNHLLFLDQQHAALGFSQAAQAQDQYGSGPLASGDFNCDGIDDLAVGIPNRDYDQKTPQAGAVHIIYGTPEGLQFSSRNRGHLLFQGPFIEETPESHDRFGAALITGNFNNDTLRDQTHACIDLAIGTPGEGGQKNLILSDDPNHPEPIWVETKRHGLVDLFYGGPQGLLMQNHQKVLPPTFYDDMEFGAALTVGQFNWDPNDDLIVGAPGDGVEMGEGYIYLFHGVPQGLHTEEYWVYSQSSTYILGNPDGMEDENDTGDRFGSSLGSGNFDGTWGDELMVGVSQESYFDTYQLGMIIELDLEIEWLPQTSANTKGWIELPCNASHCAEVLSSSGAHAADRFGAVLTSARP